MPQAGLAIETGAVFRVDNEAGGLVDLLGDLQSEQRHQKKDSELRQHQECQAVR